MQLWKYITDTYLLVLGQAMKKQNEEQNEAFYWQNTLKRYQALKAQKQQKSNTAFG